MSQKSANEEGFVIWWSGTRGQAAWLQHFSPTLKQFGRLERMPPYARQFPPALRPLFALEHPDLVVSTAEGLPLISIEITEQAAFGSNSQQRMARMWSAVANGIPSAYVLPVESFQIDADDQGRGARLSGIDPAIRDLALFVDAVPGLKLRDCQRNGTLTPEDVTAAIRCQNFDLPVRRQAEVYNFFRRHVLDEGLARHLPMVPPNEAYHEVGDRWFRAYLRRPGIPESMVLMWLMKASETTPSYPFQTLSNLERLFETNGTPHLLSYPQAPHLEFQNLPLPPGEAVVVNRSSDKDEMQHFFDFVEAAVARKVNQDFRREHFSAPNEYFDEDLPRSWRKDLEDDASLADGASGDFRMPTVRFMGELERVAGDASLSQFSGALAGLDYVNVLRIYTKTRSRPLGDPYSGMLATRDLLFCRNGAAESLQTAYWQREEGLIFWVEMRDAAIDHPFLFGAVSEQLRRNGLEEASGDLQSSVTTLLERCHPDEISKGLRAHILFCDVVVVQRGEGQLASFEMALGLPSLIRSGVLDTSAAAYRGMFA